MRFQKISIPNPWKVIGNSEGVVSKKKTFHEGGVDISWNNTIAD